MAHSGGESMSQIDEYNPYKSFRPGQKEAITEILEKFDSGEHLIELDAPTASGKSLDLYVVGMILAKERGMEKAIYTTPLVALVNQLGDTPAFSKMPILKGKRNYPCEIASSDTYASADECPFPTWSKAITHCKRVNSGGDGSPCETCLYFLERRAFKASPFGATTFARYMVDPSIHTECSVLLIDESAGLEKALIDRSALTLPDEIDLKDLRESTVEHVRTQEEIVTDLENDHVEKMKMVEEVNSEKTIEALMGEAIQIMKLINKISRVIQKCRKIINYIDTGEKFMIDSTRHFKLMSGRTEFQELIEDVPLTVLASGTPTTEIFDTPFYRVKVQHPIEVDRRICYYKPVGSMAYKERAATAPIMAKEIERLHSIHHKKTMVHCGSYCIANMLYDNLSRNAKRITILQNQGQHEREDAKTKFLSAKGEKIFLSVYFDEGIDLKGAEYPLNIIAKIPFENIGDEYIKQRNIYDNYRRYNLHPAVAVMQAAGRCTRSLDDFSETYILDSSWRSFHTRNKKLFKSWFEASLEGM